MTLHADQIQRSAEIGANVRSAKEQGLIADSDVGVGKTVETLKTAIDNANVHADAVPSKDRIKRSIDLGGSTKGSGEITDAVVAAATTVNDVINATQAANDNRRSQDGQ